MHSAHVGFCSVKVCVRCTQRKEAPKFTGFIKHPRIAGPLDQSSPEVMQGLQISRNGIGPVCIEERGSRGAVRHAKLLASRPCPVCQSSVEPEVCLVEHRLPRLNTHLIMLAFGTDMIEHNPLRRSGHVVVENSIYELDFHRLHRSAWNQSHVLRMLCLDVFNYRGRLGDDAVTISYHWEVLDRPDSRPILSGRASPIELL